MFDVEMEHTLSEQPILGLHSLVRRSGAKTISGTEGLHDSDTSYTFVARRRENPTGVCGTQGRMAVAHPTSGLVHPFFQCPHHRFMVWGAWRTRDTVFHASRREG